MPVEVIDPGGTGSIHGKAARSDEAPADRVHDEVHGNAHDEDHERDGRRATRSDQSEALAPAASSQTQAVSLTTPAAIEA